MYRINFVTNKLRYGGYRMTNYPYDYTLHYWLIMTARLAFVVVFEVQYTIQLMYDIFLSHSDNRDMC